MIQKDDAGKPNQELRSAVKNFIGQFSSDNLEARKKARLSLEDIGQPALPWLIEGVADRDHRIQVGSIKTLAEMRDPSAAQALVTFLGHEDRDVRWIAAEGLIALGEGGLEVLLQALIDHPDSTWLLQGAHHVLYDLFTGRVHEGESEYRPGHSLDQAIKARIKPVLTALEDIEPFLRLTLASQQALNTLRSLQKA
jgi:hypothetical protein